MNDFLLLSNTAGEWLYEIMGPLDNEILNALTNASLEPCMEKFTASNESAKSDLADF